MNNKSIVQSTDVVSTLNNLTNEHSDEEKNFWFEHIIKHANSGYYGIEDAEVFFWLNNIDYRCVELIKIYLRLNDINILVMIDLLTVCYSVEKYIRQAIIELMAANQFNGLNKFISEFNHMLEKLQNDVHYDNTLMINSKTHKNMLTIFGNSYSIDDFYNGFDSFTKLNIVI